MNLAIIQARLGSTRFPGKVLTPILGKPMLQWQLERLKLSGCLSQVIVATSDRPDDDRIAEFCTSQDVSCFRGSESDVLGRFYNASLNFLNLEQRKNAVIIRLTGDCPLTDPFMLDEAINLFKAYSASGCRYLGYSEEMPDGLGFEILTWDALKEAHENSIDPFEREHVTPFHWRNPTRFGARKFSKKGLLPGLRFSVDHSEDRDFVEEILTREVTSGKLFTAIALSDLVAQDTGLRAINAAVINNEGLFKTAFASEKYKVEVDGRILVKYGIALKPDSNPNDLFLDWCTALGINAYAADGAALALMKAYAGRHPEKKIQIWDTNSIPNGWRIAAPGADSQKKLSALADAPTTQGLLLETADRHILAEMLTFLCKTRFGL